MSAVLITGSAGAGKSAVAAALARRGVASLDDDEDPYLARFADSAGAVVAEEPAEPGVAWLSRHRWEWDPARLDQLIRATAPETLYLCGGAGNQLELADRFTRKFLLEIGEPAVLARLDAPGRRLGPCRGQPRVHPPPPARIPGTPAHVRGHPHRRHSAPQPGGERDTRAAMTCQHATGSPRTIAAGWPARLPLHDLTGHDLLAGTRGLVFGGFLRWLAI